MLAVLGAAFPASAGTFQVAVGSADGELDFGRATLVGEELDLESDGRGKFSFTVPHGQVSARLDISADADFKMTLLVPYFWDNSLVHQIAAAVTPEIIPRVRAFALLRVASRMLRGPLVDQVLLNQETRLIFRNVLKQARPLTPDDVKALSFFVISSKELALNNFVVVDDEMRRAVGILEDILPMTGLFENDEAIDNARIAIKQFKETDYSRMLRLVNQLSQDAAETPPSGPMCRAALSLQGSLEDMASNDQHFDEARGLRLRNNTTLAECAARALGETADVTEAELEEDLALGTQVAGTIERDLDVYRDARDLGQQDDSVARNASRRVLELDALLEYHNITR